MIVCLCKGISDRTLEKIIDEGADSVAAVGRRCGAGTDCGSCKRHIAEMVAERCEDEAPAQVWALPVLQTG